MRRKIKVIFRVTLERLIGSAVRQKLKVACRRVSCATAASIASARDGTSLQRFAPTDPAKTAASGAPPVTYALLCPTDTFATVSMYIDKVAINSYAENNNGIRKKKQLSLRFYLDHGRANPEIFFHSVQTL